MDQKQRIELLKKLVNEKILVIDGAMGTMIQNENLVASDFGGEAFEGCNEYLVLTKPKVISSIHEAYLKAGADIIESNSFGGTPLVLAEYKLDKKYHEINFEAARLARMAADRFSTPDKPRFVAGSIGPTTKAISVTGGITFHELVNQFYLQAKSLYEGGVDYFLLETCQDTRNIKAGAIALQKLNSEVKNPLPIAISGTFEASGTMLAGQSSDAFLTSLSHLDLLYIGLNCATGPEQMVDHVRTLSTLGRFPVACVPNAGLPDETGRYLESPEKVAEVLDYYAKNSWLNLVGGCCGTTPAHIHKLSEMCACHTCRTTPKKIYLSRLSGIDSLEVTDEKRPLLIGERTNSIGSKKFRDLIAESKFDEAAEIAKDQVRSGAHIIDVCLANPDRNEAHDMESVLSKIVQKIRVPLMIDSTDDEVIELGLSYSQGKAIINSINLEEGEKRFNKVVPLAKEYGAAIVVGCIDDDPKDGMATTIERKVEIATRSYNLLVNKFNFPEEDIYWDTLVFPCATGDEKYRASAKATIEGLKKIKELYPNTKSTLGISNVSFGLPPKAREAVNAVFLYHATLSGLDSAIVNSEKLRRVSSLTKEEIELCEKVLFNGSDDDIAKITVFYRAHTGVAEEKKEIIGIEQKIVEGFKQGIEQDLDELLKKMDPLSIINGPLMEGMGRVGKLFAENRLIVAEVLQSAEVMKKAVTYLEPHLKKSSAHTKGKMLLATVKGDVHDIGKNLVEIILSNNGYQIINLGIKVTSEQLIEAHKIHNPDLIGLSGLLVKSAQQMSLTAADLKQAGISTPILVGGAALSRGFTDNKISPNYDGIVAYAKDAMDGLSISNDIMGNRFEKKSTTPITSARSDETIFEKRVVHDQEMLPEAPHLFPIVETNHSIDEIYDYINPLMLLSKHLGLKGQDAKLLTHGKRSEASPKSLEIEERVHQLRNRYKKDLTSHAVYQFFKVKRDGHSIHFTQQNLKINFEEGKTGNSLANFIHSSKIDTMALFVTTVGNNISTIARELKESGNYLDSHILAALALESAEGLAEIIHQKIRRLWGVPDSHELTKEDIFKGKYHGKRFSFGYPACPNLEDQEILFKLLDVKKHIPVELTEGFMMDPEASVSALVFHHPEAHYFSVLNRSET